MRSNRLDWLSIIADLARHLGSAATLEQVRAILAAAERDVAVLGGASDFWECLERQYVVVMGRLQREGVRGGLEPDFHESVRALIAAKNVAGKAGT